jgi:hypothetical protein
MDRGISRICSASRLQKAVLGRNLWGERKLAEIENATSLFHKSFILYFFFLSPDFILPWAFPWLPLTQTMDDVSYQNVVKLSVW